MAVEYRNGGWNALFFPQGCGTVYNSTALGFEASGGGGKATSGFSVVKPSLVIISCNSTIKNFV